MAEFLEILMIVSFGISRAFGNLAGGLLAGWMGRGNVFLACSALCVVTLVVHLIAHKSAKNPVA